MGVITLPHTATTISEEKFSIVKARVTKFRRMSLEHLLAMCQEAVPGFDVQCVTNKGDTFPYLLQHEFGWQTMEAYNNEVTRRDNERKLSRRRGQLVLGL